MTYTIAKIEKIDNPIGNQSAIRAITYLENGVPHEDVTGMVGYKTRKRALETKGYIKINNETGRCGIIDSAEYMQILESQIQLRNQEDNYKKEIGEKQLEIVSFLKSAGDLKPDLLKISELKWKFLVRTALRGKNIMITGPAGSGKTLAVRSLSEAFPERKFFYFNLGATQDPRSTLIGNTAFNKEKGTYFSESLFVKAIQTENAIIMMDELSRMHPEASNILMTVLDEGQRYLRLDESEKQDTIKVADGVTFVATANIGNEYTATRSMDRALIDRFTIVEMDVLNQESEEKLLKELYPGLDDTSVNHITKITNIIRGNYNSEQPNVSTFVSTRSAVELASLLYDGFSLKEAAEVTLYPLFDSDGGVESERTFVKQVLNKFIPAEDADGNTIEMEEEELFNINDIK